MADGSSPTQSRVGVGGHFLHGGYGYQSRAWGLAMDTIVGLDATLANGSNVYASADENSDIFYALRGAVDSFGVVTKLRLQTTKAPLSVVAWRFDLAGLLRDPQVATASFLHLQRLAQNASIVNRDTSFGIYLHNGVFTVWGIHLGDLSGFQHRVRSLAVTIVLSLSSHSFRLSQKYYGTSLNRLSS